MEPANGDVPKLPDMVMCGDHPSFTKTELNAKEIKYGEKKILPPKISPSSSRTGEAVSVAAPGAAALRGGAEPARASEHALRGDARRRVRSLDAMPRGDIEITTPNRALLQAALGSFRWPPYLVCVWVLVLVLTHALHCALTLLERALPTLRKFCQYCRNWTEETWKMDGELNHRVYPLGLALLTGLFYTFYFSLYLVYAVALWAVEPLYPDVDDKQSNVDVMDTKVTNYVDEMNSKTNVKH